MYITGDCRFIGVPRPPRARDHVEIFGYQSVRECVSFMRDGIQSPPPDESAGRLDSWKEIAAYLRRQVRTVNLWESVEGLPVHRHLHSKRGTVYAYKSELDEWRRERASMQAAGLVTSRTNSARLSNRPQTMIAVLPFKNLSGDASQEYFSDGLTEEMISQLGRVKPGQLNVIARTSSMHYKGSDLEITVIGAQLRAEYVLEGCVRRCGDRVRITARLIRVADQSNLLSQSYDRELADILVLQDEVATQIAKSVMVELISTQPGVRPSLSAPTSSEAYEAYLKGRLYSNQRTEESLLKSVHYFSQAINKDPKLALAHCGLADVYHNLGYYSAFPPDEAMPLARTAALRALEIECELGEAHACLGEIRFFYDWDLDGARKEYELALALNPSYPAAHYYYASYLAVIGQQELALKEFELAQAYDPHSVIISVWKGISLWLAGRYEEAIRVCLKTLESDSQSFLAHWALGLAYEEVGNWGAAISQFKTAVALSGGNPGMLSALAYAQATSGQRDQALKTLHQLHLLSARRYVAADHIGMVHIGLGNDDEALTFLEKAFREHSSWLVTLTIEPRTARLRSNPKFQSLISSLRLRSNN